MDGLNDPAFIGGMVNKSSQNNNADNVIKEVQQYLNQK